MATTKGGILKKSDAEMQNETKSPMEKSLQGMLASAPIKKKFEDMLGKQAPAFMSSILTLASQSKGIREANPITVLAGAAQAASLGFSINPALGECYLVPYKGNVQFQLGYRGVISMCQKSGLMKSIVMVPVLKGEIKDWNKFAETCEFGQAESDEVVGYYASFELINGFKKAAYWTKDAVIKHAKTFSKSFGNGPWQTNFDAMACKTVLMSIMKTYAPKSIEFQNAVAADGHTLNITDDGNIETIDGEIIDLDVSELGGETNDGAQ